MFTEMERRLAPLAFVAVAIAVINTLLTGAVGSGIAAALRLDTLVPSREIED